MWEEVLCKIRVKEYKYLLCKLNVYEEDTEMEEQGLNN